jgi:hypothetical protein
MCDNCSGIEDCSPSASLKRFVTTTDVSLITASKLSGRLL